MPICDGVAKSSMLLISSHSALLSVPLKIRAEQVAPGQPPPAFFLAARFGFVDVGFFFMIVRGQWWQCQS